MLRKEKIPRKGSWRAYYARKGSGGPVVFSSAREAEGDMEKGAWGVERIRAIEKREENLGRFGKSFLKR